MCRMGLATSSIDGARIFMEGIEMRVKLWLWILALAFVLGSIPVFAADRDQDREENSRDGREAIDRGDRSSPDSIRGSENKQHEREWREYQKARNKSYKEWTEKDMRENGREANRAYRDLAREREGDRWEDQRERDKQWREYLRARNRQYRDYSKASRQELDDFYNYIRGRGYRYGERYGWDSGNEPRDGACFYTDSDYRGERFCLNSNERVSSVGGRYNDRISSVRIFGRARVTVYKHTNYGGSHRTYTHDAPHLGDLNDEITAIEMR
jgi:Beta/Gamma crystallin